MHPAGIPKTSGILLRRIFVFLWVFQFHKLVITPYMFGFTMNSRGESVILLHAADAFAFPLLIRSLGLVVKVQLVQPVSKRK